MGVPYAVATDLVGLIGIGVEVNHYLVDAQLPFSASDIDRRPELDSHYDYVKAFNLIGDTGRDVSLSFLLEHFEQLTGKQRSGGEVLRSKSARQSTSGAGQLNCANWPV
jgi:hypothetical protein